MSSQHQRRSSTSRILFCSDWQRRVLTDNVKRKGWQMVRPNDDWNIYWSYMNNCQQFFQRNTPRILSNCQLINHFPNSHVLTRKDILPGILRRHRREMERVSRKHGYDFRPSTYAKMDVMPESFVLPADYDYFLEAFDKDTSVTWIIKPCYTSTPSMSADDLKLKSRAYIVSRFISKPLCIAGKKCDLRFYVLVLSFRPLKAYLFKDGVCVFATRVKHTCTATLCNRHIQITNVATHRSGRKFNKYHGGKWSMGNLRLHLESTVGVDATERLFERIKFMIVHTLKAVQPIITSDRHCFECYEYELLLDGDLRPWLIDVNSSPTIIDTGGTKNEKLLKFRLVEGILNMIMPTDGGPNVWWNRIPSEHQMKCFERLIDEDVPDSTKGRKE